MNKVSRQYLEVMGIDVWEVRTELPAVAPALEPVLEPTSGALAAPLVERQLDSTHAHAPALQPKQPEPATGLPANVNSLDLIRSQLRATPPTDAELKALEKKAKAKPPVIAAEAAHIAPADSLKFLFCFLDYEDISLMLALPDTANALPAHYRRLCDDIVFALTKTRKIPRVRDLRWPMLNAAHIQQTDDDARQVIKQMMAQCREKLILFGGLTANYQDEKQSGIYLVVEDLNEYLVNPAEKKRLWQQLKTLMQVL